MFAALDQTNLSNFVGDALINFFIFYEEDPYLSDEGELYAAAVMTLAVALVELSFAIEAERADDKLQVYFEPFLLSYDPAVELEDKLTSYMQSDESLSTFQVLNKEELTSVDREDVNVAMELNIEKWGLFICMDPTYWKNWNESCKYEDLHSLSTAKINCPPIDEVTVMLKTKGRMYTLSDDVTLWEEYTFYIDQKCKKIEELKANEGSIQEFLSNAIDRFSNKTVKEFSRNY